MRSAPSSGTGMDTAGPRLRAVRTARGWSLTEVAEKAGITKGFLSLAERGLTRVSVPNLLAICAALDITLGSLFDYPEGVVVGRGTPLQMGGIDVSEFLLTAADQPQLQVLRSELAPGGNSGGAYRLDTETVFAYVLSGSLRVVVDGQLRLLEAGASTTYPGRSLHEWGNPSAAEPTTVLWIFAPPLPRSS